MNVSRDVVRDLLPVYLSGEASADTQALIEQYAESDAEVKKLIESARALRLPRLERHAPEKQKEALTATKRLLRYKGILLGGAIFCSLLPFSFGFSGGKISWMMWRDAPDVAAIYGLLAAALWIGYLAVRSRLRVTGL